MHWKGEFFQLCNTHNDVQCSPSSEEVKVEPTISDMTGHNIIFTKIQIVPLIKNG